MRESDTTNGVSTAGEVSTGYIQGTHFMTKSLVRYITISSGLTTLGGTTIQTSEAGTTLTPTTITTTKDISETTANKIREDTTQVLYTTKDNNMDTSITTSPSMSTSVTVSTVEDSASIDEAGGVSGNVDAAFDNMPGSSVTAATTGVLTNLPPTNNPSPGNIPVTTVREESAHNITDEVSTVADHKVSTGYIPGTLFRVNIKVLSEVYIVGPTTSGSTTNQKSEAVTTITPTTTTTTNMREYTTLEAEVISTLVDDSDTTTKTIPSSTGKLSLKLITMYVYLCLMKSAGTTTVQTISTTPTATTSPSATTSETVSTVETLTPTTISIMSSTTIKKDSEGATTDQAESVSTVAKLDNTTSMPGSAPLFTSTYRIWSL